MDLSIHNCQLSWCEKQGIRSVLTHSRIAITNLEGLEDSLCDQQLNLQYWFQLMFFEQTLKFLRNTTAWTYLKKLTHTAGQKWLYDTVCTCFVSHIYSSIYFDRKHHNYHPVIKPFTPPFTRDSPASHDHNRSLLPIDVCQVSLIEAPTIAVWNLTHQKTGESPVGEKKTPAGIHSIFT